MNLQPPPDNREYLQIEPDANIGPSSQISIPDPNIFALRTIIIVWLRITSSVFDPFITLSFNPCLRVPDRYVRWFLYPVWHTGLTVGLVVGKCGLTVFLNFRSLVSSGYLGIRYSQGWGIIRSSAWYTFIVLLLVCIKNGESSLGCTRCAKFGYHKGKQYTTLYIYLQYYNEFVINFQENFTLF